MTHTIKWNKDRSIRIVKFSKNFLHQLLSAHPMAANLIIAKLVEYLAHTTGYVHRIDYDQSSNKLSNIVSTINNLGTDYITNYADRLLASGFRLLDAELEILLSNTSLIYQRLHPYNKESL